jgi:hypothetical protein
MEENIEKIEKIQHKIVKRYGKYRRKISWIVIRHFTIQLAFLPYFSYLFTIQLVFLPYCPNLFTIRLALLPYFPCHFTFQLAFLPYFPYHVIVKSYGKIGQKGKSNSDKIWTIWKKDRLNSEKIWKYSSIFSYLFTFELSFLLYCPYLITIRLAFFPYFPNHFTIMENAEEK